MKNKLTTRFALLIVPIVIGVLALAPALAATPVASAKRNPLQNIPVTGTVNGTAFHGTLDIVSFQPNATNTGLVATGLLDGQYGNQTLTDFLVTGIPVTLPTSDNGPSAPNRTCAILDLSLGPLDVNLLGLVIHLDEVNLTIDAVSGPGNLLGNLLCAIAGLLDGNPLGSILGQIGDLLNRIIDLLG